jgi:hypothetical protein
LYRCAFCQQLSQPGERRATTPIIIRERPQHDRYAGTEIVEEAHGHPACVAMAPPATLLDKDGVPVRVVGATTIGQAQALRQAG